MGISRLIGLVVLVAGVALFVFGLISADQWNEQLREAFTGNFSESTTWSLLGGAGLAIVGFVMTLFGAKAKA